jgi:hypothetical protein
MPLALLTFFTGLAISAVAIYYSVLGLAAIFAAAVIPIIVMGSILEVSKLVAAWWLKANWHRAPFLLKSYMLLAVVVLMLITSMGIFGFLSKAHTDQAVPLGDTASQVAFIDEKINNERETIASARALVKQLDDAVVGIQSGEGREIRNRDGTSRIENPAERALQVRRSQARDRTALTQTIDEAQARIVKLQEEKAPIASQLRAVEAEVGPIKYIAKLIYGDDPSQNLLEKAVVWVIIVIVLVFDPLAVLLLLASQMSFKWAREERELRSESNAAIPIVNDTTEDSNVEHNIPDDVQPVVEPVVEEPQPEVLTPVEEASQEPVVEQPMVEPDQPVEVFDILPEAPVEEEEDDISEVCETEKAAIQRWKAEHPGEYAKRQRHLLEIGFIDHLPWEQYIETEEQVEEHSAAIEAARWAEEQLEESKKKDSITWMETVEGQQIKRIKDN